MSNPTSISLADMYPAYHKSVKGLDSIDVYKVHQLFNIQDPSGAIQHASKKLLLSGVRTGGKTQYQDIKEARDTLNRWLDMNAPAAAPEPKQTPLQAALAKKAEQKYPPYDTSKGWPTKEPQYGLLSVPLPSNLS